MELRIESNVIAYYKIMSNTIFPQASAERLIGALLMEQEEA